MALSLEIKELLGFTPQPSFCVKDGVVLEANAAARNRGILPTVQVNTLLRSGQEDYDAFRDGRLYLTVGVDNLVWEACVRILGDVHIFVLESDEQQPGLQALALAAVHLRKPLAGIISVMDQFRDALTEADPANHALSACMNKDLYQLQRLVGNMSDSSRYRKVTFFQPETVNIGAFVREIFEKAGTLCEQAGFQLEFEEQCGSVLCLIDREMLERALYNMLDNAMKFAPDGVIQGKLLRKGSRLYLSVSDNGSGIPQSIQETVYNRYLRQPEAEDGLWGLGLGMSLICSVSRAHAGTVLLQQNAGGGTKITLAFPIRQNKGELRSNVKKIDYAGERDHALIELSGSLPSKVYEN